MPAFDRSQMKLRVRLACEAVDSIVDLAETRLLESDVESFKQIYPVLNHLINLHFDAISRIEDAALDCAFGKPLASVPNPLKNR